MLANLEIIPETVRRESAFALTLGCAVAGAAVGSLVFGPGRTPFVMLLVFGLTGFSVSDPAWSPKRLGGWSLVGTLIALVAARSIHVDDVLEIIPFVIPGALVFGLLVLSLTGTLRTLFEAGSHEDAALSRVSASRWLLAVAVTSGLVAAVRLDLPLGVASVLVALFAAVRWALGRDALTTRRRWLGHVRDGDAMGWSVADVTQVEELETLRLRPLIRATPLDGVLVKTGPGGPYRGGLGGTPVALVPRAAFRVTRIPATVSWKDAGVVVAFLGALALPFFAFELAEVLLESFLEAPRNSHRVLDPTVTMLAFAICAPGTLMLSYLARAGRQNVWLTGAVSFAITVGAIIVLAAD